MVAARLSRWPEVFLRSRSLPRQYQDLLLRVVRGEAPDTAVTGTANRLSPQHTGYLHPV